MAKNDIERIGMENVKTPGRVVRVDAAKYNAMREALLSVLPTGTPGLTSAAIKERLLPLVPEEYFLGGEKVGWWLKGVQLDLETKGIIVREKTKPLRFCLR